MPRNIGTRDIQKITDYAAANLSRLEKAGYLHNDYDRFKEITDYHSILQIGKLQKLGDEVIRVQEEREQKCYTVLGVSNAKELNEKYLSDEGVRQVLDNNIDISYGIIDRAFKEGFENGSLKTNVTDRRKDVLVKSLQNILDKNTEQLTKDYQKNLDKIRTEGGLSYDSAQILANTKNKRTKTQYKTGGEFAASVFSQWKGRMGEAIVGMFASQLNNIKGVEVTGSNLDEFGKFIKSDVTTYSEDISIGFTVKNYKLKLDANGQVQLDRPITLHGGGNFESYLQRLESLKSENFQGDINNIVDSLKSDNYYYNLINEAVNKTTFLSSKPAEEFLQLTKELAAAWIGTEFITDTIQGGPGQNIDFLVISRFGVIPISTILKEIKKGSSTINVSMKSTAEIDMENLYEDKINRPWAPTGAYSNSVLNVGHYAGREVYQGITIGEIKLSLLLSQIKL